MHGTDITRLRQALGLDASHFAQLIGVHPSTIYRWEAMGDAPIKIEPFQMQLLAVLTRQVNAVEAASSKALGDAILQGILVGGATFGLFKLLEAVFAEPEPRRTGGSRTRGTSSRTRSSPKKKET